MSAREIDPQRLLDAFRHHGVAFEKRNNGFDLFAPARQGRDGLD